MDICDFKDLNINDKFLIFSEKDHHDYLVNDQKYSESKMRKAMPHLIEYIKTSEREYKSLSLIENYRGTTYFPKISGTCYSTMKVIYGYNPVDEKET